MNQYLRKWAILLNGEPFIDSGPDHQFRCVFDITVSPFNSQSFADIRIYNLAKTTAIERGSPLSFSAGYENNYDNIFLGIISNVFREREGPNVVTRILCRSGSPANDRGSASASYGPGTLVVDVLQDLARAWPRLLDLDETQFDDKPDFPSGYIADGDIPGILDSLAYQFDFSWIQERGSLVISRNGRDRATPVYEINQFTGMVGIPEVSKGPDGLGVYLTTRINPSIRCNSRINVQSEYATYNTGNIFIQELSGDASANGEYNVLTMHYVGDSHGDIWDLNIDALRPGITAQTSAPGQALPDTGASLIWGQRVDQAFRNKTREIAKELRMEPNWLMAIMAFETGKTFNPAQPNNAGGAAIGLIQFMPATARGLGTTSAQLAGMTAVQQLEYVKKYFSQYQARIKNFGDAYMAVLWPIAIGKPDDYVMWEQNGQYARQYASNSNLDINRDGKITRGEAVRLVNNAYMEGVKYIR